MHFSAVAPPRGERGLKFLWFGWYAIHEKVAPPRGERGLKFANTVNQIYLKRRSPSWGAWIEILNFVLKSFVSKSSLPLVGSVD